MIVPAPGVAFTAASDGDMLDAASVEAVSAELDIPPAWAVVSQVHGAAVHRAVGPGNLGPGDAVVTEAERLPVSVRTADCIGVVAHAAGRVGAAHAGWRGLASGILESFAREMGDAAEYYIGPAIGPCCYEVGDEVAKRFPDHVSSTSWGTQSVDVVGAAHDRLGTVVWSDGRCTNCDTDLLSHRRDGTSQRLAAIGWR